MEAESTVYQKVGQPRPAWVADFTETVMTQLEAGADVDAAKTGQTLLMIAVQRGDLDIARTLTNRGVNPDLRNKLGFTALHLAVLQRNTEMVRLLLGFVSDIDSRADYRAYRTADLTPLMMSIMQDDFETAEILIDAGSDINYSRHWGTSVSDGELSWKWKRVAQNVTWTSSSDPVILPLLGAIQNYQWLKMWIFVPKFPENSNTMPVFNIQNVHMYFITIMLQYIYWQNPEEKKLNVNIRLFSLTHPPIFQ